MSEIADRDENYVPVITGVSTVDGETVLEIYVNPDCDGAGTHGLVVSIE